MNLLRIYFNNEYLYKYNNSDNCLFCQGVNAEEEEEEDKPKYFL